MVRIIDGGFRLIDWTGLPTYWGHWDPVALNDEHFWYDGRGINSLQILSFVRAAYGMASPAQQPFFAAAYANLTSAALGYQYNILNAKITEPDDLNYSDDELTYLPYLTWAVALRHSPGLPAPPMLAASLLRTWSVVRLYRPPLWAGIAVAAGQDLPHEDRAAAVQTLRAWPTETIDWPVNNTARLNLEFVGNAVARGDSSQRRPVTLMRHDEILVRRAQGGGVGAVSQRAWSAVHALELQPLQPEPQRVRLQRTGPRRIPLVLLGPRVAQRAMNKQQPTQSSYIGLTRTFLLAFCSTLGTSTSDSSAMFTSKCGTEGGYESLLMVTMKSTTGTIIKKRLWWSYCTSSDSQKVRGSYCGEHLRGGHRVPQPRSPCPASGRARSTAHPC